MTYSLPIQPAAEPWLERLSYRRWGGLGALQLRASAGLHEAAPALDHRLIFYTGGVVRAQCRSDRVRESRLQSPGQFDLLPAGASGAWEDDGPTEMVSIEIAPAVLERASRAAGRGGVPDLAPALGLRDPQVAHVVGAIAAELVAGNPTGRLYAEALAGALAARLLHTAAPAPARRGQSLSRPQLRRLADYVDANLDRDLTLEELSGVVGLSVSHLTPLFRRATGQTLHRYVVERRVSRAAELLAAGEGSIAQIALATGFSHQSHLAMWMKRLRGRSPAEARAASRACGPPPD